MTELEEIAETYSFNPDDLAPERRAPGISAFMRIRNGADFLETTIRSHIDHFDEIVAVYNQCTDATPDILRRLAGEYGPKLRVIHYLPQVFPPGSDGHRNEPPTSPRSLVTYYNFALARTRFSVATKLDDDHLGMRDRLAAMTGTIRREKPAHMVCFSGFNLADDGGGRCGILATEPFSGTGDIGFFPVSRETYFAHDRRFERFHRGALRRTFGGFVYWHLKFLKPEFGFAVYRGADGQLLPRYQRKRDEFAASHPLIGFAELRRQAPAWVAPLAPLPVPDRLRFRIDRWQALANAPTDAELAVACAAVRTPAR
jgi:hypothetical protein